MRVFKVLVLSVLLLTSFASLTLQPGTASADHCSADTIFTPNISGDGHSCQPKGAKDATTKIIENQGGTTIQGLITGIVYAFTVWVGSWVAYVASYVFGFAAGITLQSEAYSLTFLADMWKLVRDIANIAFLFILIYIAFTVMFRAETRGTMQLLAGVIIVALLVNFSFFFTRVIIDAGNILAVQFYNAIDVPTIQGTVKDLSAVVMQGTEVQRILSQDSFRTFADGQEGWTGWLSTVGALSAIYITVGIMLFILAAMFLAAGIKLLLRTAVLWLLLIASHLAFIAAALPNTRSHAQQWLSMLFSHAFYPAFFLFIFLIIARFVGDMGSGSVVTQALSASIADPRNGGMINLASTIAQVSIRMGFVVVLMYIALRLADSLSVAGAGLASKATGKYWGAVGGGFKWAGGGAAGLAYRYGVSRPAYYGAQGLADSRFGNTRVGQLLRKTDNYLAKKSVGGVKSYADVVKVRDEREKDKRTNLDRVQAQKDSDRLAEVNQEWEKQKDMLETLRNNKKNGITLDPPAEARLAELEKLATERAKLAERAKGMSNAEVTSLSAANIEAIVQQLTEAQIKAIKESTKFSTGEIDRISKKWHEENEKAPIGKSYKELEKLDKIHNDLKDLHGLDIKRVAERTPRTKEGNVVVTLKAAKDTLEDLEKHRDTQVEAKERAGTKEERGEAQAKINQLNKAIKKAESVIEGIEKVPEAVGGREAPHEYEIKKTKTS
jgi:hypothetical protein